MFLFWACISCIYQLRHLKDERKYYLDQQGTTPFYIRTFPIDKYSYHCARQLFSGDRAINVESAENNKEYKGPDFNVVHFNCHKYAAKFLIRIGIVDGFLLKFNYPTAVDKGSKYFQLVNLKYTGNKLWLLDDNSSTATPEPHNTHSVNYPASYYQMANTSICNMLNRFNTTEQLRSFIQKYHLEKNLYSLSIRILEDYRKTGLNRIIHAQRHHTQTVNEIIINLRSYSGTNPMYQLNQMLNKYMVPLTPELITINPSGSFFMRLLFIKELIPLNANLYSPSLSRKSEHKSGKSASYDPLDSIGYSLESTFDPDESI
ncbi:MAG: hypothetical protein GY750_11710 [Lentisphaerae bacterium]|nr:hypothetical protein [Lentisphaerota bacterium]